MMQMSDLSFLQVRKIIKDAEIDDFIPILHLVSIPLAQPLQVLQDIQVVQRVPEAIEITVHERMLQSHE